MENPDIRGQPMGIHDKFLGSRHGDSMFTRWIVMGDKQPTVFMDILWIVMESPWTRDVSSANTNTFSLPTHLRVGQTFYQRSSGHGYALPTDTGIDGFGI